MRRISGVAGLLLFACIGAAAAAAGSPLDLKTLASDDIDPKTFGPAKWLDEGKAYTTIEESKPADTKPPKDLVRYDTATGKRTVLIAATHLIPAGAKAPLVIEDYEWSKDRKRLLIYTNPQKVWRRKTRGDYWLLDLHTKQLRQLGPKGTKPATLMFASFSPDGSKIAYLRRDHGETQMPTNIYVEDAGTGKVTPLTHDAALRNVDGSGKTIINGTADWVNEEELHIRKAYEWSPDSTRIAYWQFDATAVKDFYLINNTDDLYSRLIPIPYPKTGATNSTVRIGIVAATGGPTNWAKLDGDPANFYIARADWSKDSRDLILQRLDRLQQKQELLAAEAGTGTVRTLLTETSKTWIDVVDDFKWLSGGREFLWVSEREGWRQVYAVSRDGSASRLLTPGRYDVTSVVSVDEKQGLLYFLASPDNAGQRYLYRAPLSAPEAGAAVRVTPAPESGTHGYDIAPNGRWAFHTSSTADAPPLTALVSLPGHRTQRVLITNDALHEKVAPLFTQPTEFFKVSVPIEGSTEQASLDGWMLKPPGFDPSKKYPVLVYVYSEPAAQTVLDKWGGKRTLFHRYIASQGYIVLSIDNRGTPAPKGHAWRHVIYGAVGFLPAEEQAAALRALGAERSYLDLDRVAVWGWSGGGSMTLHLMFRHPELYKVGMSVAPMPDQRYYDTIYQERYMGTPQGNPEGYEKGSPINYAEGLRGKLLIAGGTGDDNCHYQVVELMTNRLIALGKQFDFMSYPNRSHAIDEGEGTLAHLFATLERHLETNLPANGRGAAAKRAPAPTIESNIVYGMYSGAALLLDAHRPAAPNGKGIVVIPGSGWQAPLEYGATGLKDSRPAEFWSALTDAGYTLFILNHRATPRFHYPDPLQDAQRAVRFVRYNALRFGVDPDHLGALGHSSGGHLVSLLGTLEGAGDPKDADPVNRESARVQAVVAGAAPTDLTQFDNPLIAQMAAILLGKTQAARELYREASPITHVTAQSAPFLLVHGDADEAVPFRNSQRMERALREAGVDVEFMPLPGANHSDFPVRLAVPWLNRHLLMK